MNSVCQYRFCATFSRLMRCRKPRTTFWILVSLVENYDMRQLYQVGIPGHILFGEVLSSLVEQHLPSFADCLTSWKISHSDFFGNDGESPSWISSLNAGIIPVEVMDQFISHFLRHGWAYYFGLYLAFLDSISREIRNIVATG